MRIIDKNKDFYDYLQNPTDNIVFDRRDSFLLTKEIFCDNLRYSRCYQSRNCSHLMLLQICNTFWLFLINIIKTNDYGNVLDYEIDFINTWKDYDKKRVLINLNSISFDKLLLRIVNKQGFYRKESILSYFDEIKADIKHGNYRVDADFTKYTQFKNGKNYSYIYEEKHIPLLKACGLANYIDPVEIFCSFEEYFSLEKTSQEKTEALGTTNTDKIEMHGFDKKISFRGKSRQKV